MSDHAARFARLEFERFQPRAFEDFGGIRDRFAEMAAVFTPLEVVDALGVSSVRPETHTGSRRRPLPSRTTGQSLQPPLGSDLLEDVDRSSGPSIVHRSCMVGIVCPSQNSREKARRSGHHDGHQNRVFVDTMMDTMEVSH